MQLTSHGQDGGSQLILVFDGPQGRGDYGSSILVNCHQIVAAMERLARTWTHPNGTRSARRNMSKPTSVRSGQAIQSAKRTASIAGPRSNGRQLASVIAYGTQKSAPTAASYQRQSATRGNLRDCGITGIVR